MKRRTIPTIDDVEKFIVYRATQEELERARDYVKNALAWRFGVGLKKRKVGPKPLQVHPKAKAQEFRVGVSDDGVGM